MDRQEIIKKTETFVKETLGKDSTGHDWWHIHRVRNLAKRIALHEDADIFIVELSALLHDIGDYKFFQGDEEAGAVKVGSGSLLWRFLLRLSIRLWKLLLRFLLCILCPIRARGKVKKILLLRQSLKS